LEGLGEKFLTQGLPILIGLVVSWFALKFFVRIAALLTALFLSGLLTFVFYQPLTQFSEGQVGPFLKSTSVDFLQQADPLWICMGIFFLLTFVMNAILLSKVIKYSSQ